MNKYICLIVILIIIICSLIKSDGLYISKSTIDGLGLFAGKDYKTGNILQGLLKFTFDCGQGFMRLFIICLLCLISEYVY